MSHRRPIVSLSPEPLPFRRDESIEPPLAQLPLPLTSFVGRTSEVAAIGAMLDRPDVRLVTLTGPGGIGKTRLVVRVAEEWASAFTDGVAFVPLADVRDPDRMAAVVAETIGDFGLMAKDPVEAVQRFLADRVFLLILDNFEHLLRAAPILAQWLSHCPWLTILVTSRFRVRISGEHEIVVRPLPLPAAETTLSIDRLSGVPSIQLFVERAQAARADFALNTANSEAVATLCTRLEGLPLAIELAAARISHMGPRDLLERLMSGVPVLVDGPHDQPDRLRSLERAIAWSFDLLTTAEQDLLQRLSVFAGGFDLEAAEAIATTGAGTMDGIASLVNKSFLAPQDVDGFSRYTMLESIRGFAAARLDASGEMAAIRERHAMYFLELAERDDTSIWGGPGHRQALARLEIDLANFRVALAWLEGSGDGVSLLRLAAALSGIWHYRSHWQEARSWLTKGLFVGGDAVPKARAIGLAKLTVLNRDLAEGPDPVIAAEAVELYRLIEDDRGTGRTLYLLSTLIPAEDTDRKLALLEESRFYSTRAGSPTSLGWVDIELARLRWRAGDLDGARELVRESVAYFRDDDFPFGITCGLIELAVIEGELGDVAGAAGHLVEAIRLWPETRSKELLFNAMSRTADLACTLGNTEDATTLLSSLDVLGQSARLHASPSVLERAACVRARAMVQLSGSRFSAAWEQGRHATIDRMIADGLELLASIRAPTSIAQRPVGGLTIREMDVIRLVATGMSNREIARELSIGETTVISHVRSILSKLGLSSRTAAAAWAIRNGFDQPSVSSSP
jgi:non-specific serine/threonine protein kinase